MEFKFTDANFEQEVLKSEMPVLVDFYADWCGPCKMMAPNIEKLAQLYNGRVKVGKMNIDENMTTPMTYSVMSIPTIILFKDGKPVNKTVGYTELAELEKMIKE